MTDAADTPVARSADAPASEGPASSPAPVGAEAPRSADTPRGAGARSGVTIESGVDAVVLGAGVDGLAASALLAKSGLKTVLIEAGLVAAAPEREQFAPGFYCDDNDQLLWALDPQLVSALDLHRFGFRYAARRIQTVYVAPDGTRRLLKGDVGDINAFAEAAPGRAAPAVSVASALRSGRDGGGFMAPLLEAARSLKGYFSGEAPPAAPDDWTRRLSAVSLEALLRQMTDDPHTASALLAEGALRAAARPDAPMSAFALARRFAGEIAGLQGGVGYPKEGLRGLTTALRRAGQSYGVEYRHAGDIARVLVEWDRVEGVEFTSGGQIRTPVVVTGFEAHTAYAAHIGRALVDVEFLHHLEPPRRRNCSVHAHLAFDKSPDNEEIGPHLRRRLVRAPSLRSLKEAHRAAREGRCAAGGVMEMFFPSAFNPDLAPPGGATGIATYGPVPTPPSMSGGDEEALENWRKDAERAVREAFAAISEPAAARISGVRVAPIPNQDVVVRAAARARLAVSAAAVGGYFYCGPDASLAAGCSGAAGRRAADAAIAYFRKSGG